MVGQSNMTSIIFNRENENELTRALAIGVHPPAVTRIDELPGSSGRILPAQRFAAQGLVIGFYSIGFDVHGTLPGSRGHRELGHPRAGSCNIARFYLTSP